MEASGTIIALISLLFLVSVLSDTITPRLGIPVLLLYLVVGMLAGEDGLPSAFSTATFSPPT